MKDVAVTIYRRSEDLPTMEYKSFFHGKSLFALYEQTPRHVPYMAVATDADGKVLCNMLAVVRHRFSVFPPYIYRHCRIHGEGDYHHNDKRTEEAGYPKGELFGLVLSRLTKELQGKVLYFEFSHISTKMFGYKQFRTAGYFPVHWMSIHNSLHSKAPEERLGRKTKRYIEDGYKKGVETKEVEGDEEFAAFSELMHRHNILKPKRYIPGDIFFRGLKDSGSGKLFITKYKGMTIGCCACVYSDGNAYLWYAAFRRKSFIRLHPDTMTIWHAIRHAYNNGYGHIFFMDVGLPFSKNPFREFILRFGGKPASTFRWFRISVRWLNAMACWMYR